MKELEKELSQKASSLSELKRQLKETSEREERARINIQQLEDQVIFTARNGDSVTNFSGEDIRAQSDCSATGLRLVSHIIKYPFTVRVTGLTVMTSLITV